MENTQSIQTDHNALLDLQKDIILSDTPEGFALFFAAVFNRPLMDHAKRWIEKVYEAKRSHRGMLIESFRYSWKSTVLSNAFVAYRIGLEPHKTSIIIQVKDETAEQTAKKIADIIATNPAWKWIFPNVVPDAQGRGWANKGYYVKRTDMPYGDWLRMCGRDPTFVGYGVTSDSIIGKHPNGCLIIDDIHNEQNTASAKELNRVIDILTGTIFPTISADQTWVVFVGTPWNAMDAMSYVKGTGMFMHDVVRVMDDNGVPTWPQHMDENEIARLRRLSGEIQFRRMYMCDIEAAEGMFLKREWISTFPYENIRKDWPVVFGVDYASVDPGDRMADRDYFALAIGYMVPSGGIVLVDGVYEKLTQAEAEQRIRAMAAVYPSLKVIGFENVGKGEEMYHFLLRTTNLPIMPQSPGNRKKAERFEKLGSVFQLGRIRISDVQTPFIEAFMNEWLTFPSGRHDDALDAVYYMTASAANQLLDFAIPDPGELMTSRVKVPSPWTRVTRRVGHG